MDWILTLKIENQIPNLSATPVLHKKQLSPNLCAETEPSLFYTKRMTSRMMRTMRRYRKQNTNLQKKKLKPAWPGRLQGEFTNTTHSALSRHFTVQSGQAQVLCRQSLKSYPRLFFFYVFDEIKCNKPKKNFKKNTALRDKSAQNCAKTSPQTTVRPLLFKNSSMISTRCQLSTSPWPFQNNSPTNEYAPRPTLHSRSKCLQVWTPNYNGKKWQDIFLKVCIFWGGWMVLASFSRAAQC